MSSVLSNWDDILLLDQQLSDEEKIIRDSAKSYCQNHLAPRVIESFRNEETDITIFKEMGEQGLLGLTIDGYGCAGANYVSYGLVAREVERIDSGFSFHDECAIKPCYASYLHLCF